VPRGEGYTGKLKNEVVDALERHRLLRVEDRSGERLYELAHDTLIDPVCARGANIDTPGLESLWARTIREIARSVDWIQVDEDDLLTQCGEMLVDRNGSPLPVRTSEEPAGGLPLWVIDAILEQGFVQPESGEGAPQFRLCHPRLARAIHQIRLAEEGQHRPFANAVRVVFASVTATSASLLFTTITRAILAGFNLTMTEPPPARFLVGMASGWFQGVIGALVWGLCISFALSCRLVRGERLRQWRSSKVLPDSILVGSIAGLFGGALVDLALLYAQQLNTLYRAQWILTPDAQPLTAFTVTRMGYSMLIYGAALGWGTGYTTVAVMLSGAWKSWGMRARTSSLDDTLAAFGAILQETLLQGAVGFLPVMSAAAALLYFVVRPPGLLPKLLGECLSITIGGVGIAAGLLFGLSLLRRGIAIPGEVDVPPVFDN
jgi:hypothetical protein